MSIKHNYLSVISEEDMKKFIEETFKIDVDCLETMLDEEVGKLFVCMSKQNLIEYTGEDSNWCVFGDFGIVKKSFTDDSIETNFKFAELKPHLFRKYVSFVAEQNMINGHPNTIDNLTYGESVCGTFAEFVLDKPRKKLANLFGKKEDSKTDLTELLARIERDITDIECVDYELFR